MQRWKARQAASMHCTTLTPQLRSMCMHTHRRRILTAACCRRHSYSQGSGAGLGSGRSSISDSASGSGSEASYDGDDASDSLYDEHPTAGAAAGRSDLLGQDVEQEADWQLSGSLTFSPGGVLRCGHVLAMAIGWRQGQCHVCCACACFSSVCRNWN